MTAKSCSERETSNISMVVQDADMQGISERMQQIASELEQVRVDARENAALYQKDAAEAKVEAFKAHSQAARAQAEADYEAGRAGQLADQLEDMKRHLSTVVSNNARHQVGVVLTLPLCVVSINAVYAPGRPSDGSLIFRSPHLMPCHYAPGVL